MVLLRSRFVGSVFLCLCATLVHQPAHAQIPAVQRYFSLTRQEFSGERARAVVAFMDDYFRVPGNTGFNASIRRVEDVLKAAGYIEQSQAKAGARLTYRIEKRPLNGRTWEPVDASVTIVG